MSLSLKLPRGRDGWTVAVGGAAALLFSGLALWFALPAVYHAYTRLRAMQTDFGVYHHFAAVLVRAGRTELLFAGQDAAKAYHRETGGYVPGGYAYAPTFAYITAPLAYLKTQTSFDVWKTLVAACSVGLALAVAGSFRSWPWRIAAVAAGVTWAPVYVTAIFGQTGEFVAAITCAGALLYLRYPSWGAAVLGLLVFKPTALIGPAAFIFSRSARTWWPFALSAMIVGLTPFLWLGLGAFRGWVNILLGRGFAEASGNGLYLNEGLNTAFDVTGITSRAIVLAFGFLLVATLVVLSDRLDTPALLAMAIIGGLLINPHSVIYDWPAALIAVLLLRRSSTVGWLGTDVGAGLLLISLYCVGQYAWWSIGSRPSSLEPLAGWGIVVFLGLAAWGFLRRAERASEPLLATAEAS